MERIEPFYQRQWNVNMKMHLAASAVALVVCLVASTPVQAAIEVKFAETGDKVTLYDSAGNNGGIFKVDVDGKTSSGVTFNYGNAPYYDFFTFCVEINESISFGTKYTVLNANATKTVNSNKTLGSFAAWLYTKFLEPVLTGVPVSGITAIANWGGDLSRDANAIQYGIWKSMGWSDGGGPNNGNSGKFGGQLGAYDKDFLTSLKAAYAADTTWTSGLAADANWNRGTTTGNVKIMNLVTLYPNGNVKKHYQDQLVWSPPPDGPPPTVPEPMSFLVWSTLAMCVGSAGLRCRDE